jgi:integrase
MTFAEYRTATASVFLTSLADRLGRRSLAHLRSLSSGIFSHAVNLGVIESNPWHDSKILGKVRAPGATKHYTLEEAEDVISALVDHVDCQLIMALAFFLGLRPGEIAALRWEDFDDSFVHIRRAVVRGIVGETKTPESVATLPLIQQVKTPLALWRQKCGNPPEGWVFKSRKNTPVDLHNVIARVIVPTLKAKNVVWKELYAGRRGAGTAVIELTNGNYAAAQELLRHKSMNTTLAFYKKQTESALMSGMKLLEAAASPKGSCS